MCCQLKRQISRYWRRNSGSPVARHSRHALAKDSAWTQKYLSRSQGLRSGAKP